VRVGAYTVERDAFDALPESVAREECVLPLSLAEGVLRVVAGRREPEALTTSLRRVAYITRLRLRYSVADHGRVAALVHELFNSSFSEVSGCAAEFEVRCPRRWLELTPTSDPAVRYCGECGRQVFWADDEQAALSHARLGRCVALCRSGVESEIGMLRFPDEGE
jgi:hypothetical protein